MCESYAYPGTKLVINRGYRSIWKKCDLLGCPVTESFLEVYASDKGNGVKSQWDKKNVTKKIEIL